MRSDGSSEESEEAGDLAGVPVTGEGVWSTTPVGLALVERLSVGGGGSWFISMGSSVEVAGGVLSWLMVAGGVLS